MRRVAWCVLGALAIMTAFAGALSPNDPTRSFPNRTYAPPMRVHLFHNSQWQGPFVYAQRLDDRISSRYSQDRSRPLPLRWFRDGRLVSLDSTDGPLLLLGGDALGRDAFARMLHGARLSLGVALVGTLGALIVGVLLGTVAGMYPGRVDATVMALADMVIALPAVYLVLVLRAALPLVLDTGAVFALLAPLFVVAASPSVARGVRAIVAVERTRDYIEASRAAGAGWWRLVRHLVPASGSFLRTQFVLLVPALLVAESTISYLGLGFPEPHASWGLMLRDGTTLSAMRVAPWLMAPAVALLVVAVACQAVLARSVIDSRAFDR
jgi:peptide/nickel transport system permease protein